MVNSWFIIVNPIAGNLKFSTVWKKIQLLLDVRKINYSFAVTLYSRHEVELVQNAIQKGFRNIISVGGDGTLHHVVNGIMIQRYVKSSDITIGVIPLGTGNDWIKTYNIPNNIEKAIELIHYKKTILQDIGVANTENNKVSYFNNVAGLGYDGYTVNKLKKMKSFGAVAYLLSGLAGFLFYKKTIFKINFNSKSIETNCLMTMVGVCKFSGGGMQFSEKVNPNDGLFDITVVKNLTLFDLILNIRKLYNGKITEHPKVATYQTNEITIIPQNSNTYIQGDGELIGIGSATFSIIEKGVRFVIASF